MAKKQSSARAAKIAARVLAGGRAATDTEVRTLAASVLGQREATAARAKARAKAKAGR